MFYYGQHFLSEVVKRMATYDLNRGKCEMNDNCSICLAEMKNPIKLPCNHQFHAECVLDWFRRSGSCPICRDAVDPEERNSYSNMKAQFMIKKRLAQRKDAPARLKQLVRMHKKKMENLKQAKRDLKEWKSSEDGKTYRKLRTKMLQLQRRTFAWNRFNSRRSVEKQIALYPVVPLVMRRQRRAIE